MRVLVLNGVNLGRLGRRQPDVYGASTHDDLAAHLVETGAQLGFEVKVLQTDAESDMVRWLHEAADNKDAVIINPGAWSHYSVAIVDALAEVECAIEVHISNIAARETFRHHSVVSSVVKGTITGLGLGGYDLALAHLASLNSQEQ